jgi:hypothetical protein
LGPGSMQIVECAAAECREALEQLRHVCAKLCIPDVCGK